MTSTLKRGMPPIPPSTEWEKAQHAQHQSELLKDFIRWLRGEGLLYYNDDLDKLISEFYDINIDKLADEQEAWAWFDLTMKHELGIDE